ncbi:ubiquinone anaerobic biosynthesis accessory factor UbiT [Azospirillum largimobile]
MREPMREPAVAPTAIDDDRARRFEASLSRAGLGLVPWLGERVSDALLARLLRVLAERHPRAFDALREMQDARVLIEPVDAPVALVMRVGPELSLHALPRGAEGAAGADAVIRGPYARLLDLLEGRIDGDALFFRRELTISGDTALILALRNTLDGEEMDLMADAASIAGPLARALPVLRRNAGPVLDRVEAARWLLPPPLRRGIERIGARIEARLTGTVPGTNPGTNPGAGA